MCCDQHTKKSEPFSKEIVKKGYSKSDQINRPENLITNEIC